MNIYELKNFISENIANFINTEIVEQEGICYHYTSEWNKIKSYGKFKGAEINCDLDQTQNINNSLKALNDVGVVFAYENIIDAREEGFGLDIVKIHYRTAIKSLHNAENNLSLIISEVALKQGIEILSETPPTLLILTTDIISFEIM